MCFDCGMPPLQGKGSSGGKGPKTFGPAMHAAGRAWIGKVVLRYWEDQGGWWEALVGDYSVKNSKHKLIYDAGGEDVSALPLYCPVSLPGRCCVPSLAVALVLSVFFFFFFPRLFGLLFNCLIVCACQR